MYFFTYLLRIQVKRFLYNNQMNVRALIGRSAMVYCASKLMENNLSSDLLFESNTDRPQVCMVL